MTRLWCALFHAATGASLDESTKAGSTFARGLGEPSDGLEDPFTGSSTGCMAAYLWKYRLVKDPHFVAEQGHWMNGPGSAEVTIVGTRDAIQTIKVSGQGVTLIEGEITI